MDLKAVKQLRFANADAIARKILALFEAGEFDVATLYFSEFKSVISTEADRAAADSRPSGRHCGHAGKSRRAASMNSSRARKKSWRRSIARNIATQVFRGLLENAASEQGARMSAMDSATRNAGDMINKLTIKYNRQRQANITKELIEIISGAEAL